MNILVITQYFWPESFRINDMALGLKERGILVRYFSSPELRDSIRVTVGTDEEIEILLKGLEALMA